MTREEAIEIIRSIDKAYRTFSQEEYKAMEMAIEALKQEPCGDAISRKATVERLCKVADFMNERRNGLGSPYIMAALFIQDNKDEFPPVTPQMKDEDVAKAFQLGLALGFGEKHDEMDKVLEEVKKVITPQPKMGLWISLDDFRGKYNECGYKCSECGEHSDYEENFCPNCGAKMEVEK